MYDWGNISNGGLQDFVLSFSVPHFSEFLLVSGAILRSLQKMPSLVKLTFWVVDHYSLA